MKTELQQIIEENILQIINNHITHCPMWRRKQTAKIITSYLSPYIEKKLNSNPRSPLKQQGEDDEFGPVDLTEIEPDKFHKQQGEKVTDVDKDLDEIRGEKKVVWEITDEEVLKEARRQFIEGYQYIFVSGAEFARKWYRDQIKINNKCYENKRRKN